MRTRIACLVSACLLTATVLLLPTPAGARAPIVTGDTTQEPQVTTEAAPLVSVSAPIEVTLTPPTDDAFGDQARPNMNFGSEPTLDVARVLLAEHYYHRISVIRFDLSSIPAGSTIEQAVLRLHLTGAAGLSSVTVGIGRITNKKWSEKTVTYSYPGLECSQAVSTVAVSDKGPFPKAVLWNATALVKAWVEQGTANYGLCVHAPYSGDPYIREFSSKEGANDPALWVKYSPPPTATPAATATHTATATATPTSTSTKPSPTPTPTATHTGVPFQTPTSTATRTPTRTPTITPTGTVTPTAGPTVDPTCPDLYEPNDTFAAARALSGGVYYARICAADDEDWFSVGLVQLQTLLASLENLPANYDLELYDPLGGLLAGSYGPGTTPETRVILADWRYAYGSYRVRVFGFGGAFNTAAPYRLKLEPGLVPTATPTREPTATHTPAAPCAFDVHEAHEGFEYNDMFESATSISTGLAINAYICPDFDRDYFRFPVEENREIRVRLYDLPQDYRLELIGPDETVVGRAGDDSTADRELTYLACTSGDYRVLVKRGSHGDPIQPYALQVDADDPGAMTLFAEMDTYVYPDDDDPHGTAQQLLVGRDEMGQEQQALFHFDLNDLPGCLRTIHSAAFLASLSTEGATRAYTVELMRVTGSWDEDTLTWPWRPELVSTGTTAEVGVYTDTYFQWDATDSVQQWLDAGYGSASLALRPQEDTAFSRGFHSRDSSSSRPPKLVINYIDPSPGPPGSIGGRVYDDADGDGSYDSGEDGIAGIPLELSFDAISQGVQTTDYDGTYAFSGLSMLGEYFLGLQSRMVPAEFELLDQAQQDVWLAAGENRDNVNFRVTRRPTPTPTPPVTLNFTAEAMEFIQVIHGADLIAGKPTLVRVYVGVAGVAEAYNVSGVLFPFWGDPEADGIDPIARADLLASTDPMNDPAVVGDMSRTLNFLLPDDWTTAGYHEFMVWVNYYYPGLECPTCWNDRNQCYEDVIFHSTAPLRVAMIPVTVSGIAPTVSDADTYRWMLKTYPFDDVVVYDAGSLEGDYDLTDREGWEDLLYDIGQMWRWDGGLSTPRFADLHYYGMVSDAVPLAGTNGIGYTDKGDGKGPERRHAAAGVTYPGSDESGEVMAHEFGHNLARPHTCGTGGEADCVVQHDHPGGVIGVYGVDMANPHSPAYLDPAVWYDLMTYKSDRWPSDVTFEALQEWYITSATSELGAPQAAVDSLQEYLVGSGQISDGLVIMRQPWYRLMLPAGTSDDPREGPYTLELLDANGTPLFTRYFRLTDVEGGMKQFDEVVPWQPGTARVVIRQDQNVLLITYVSPHAPDVTLLAPNGGEAWPPYGRQTISWSGSDADGEPLHYVLQYSPDAGSSWRTVATGLTGDSFSLDVGNLPGSQTALLRVIASDGVNTAQDTSDATFTVEGKPPTPFIVYPLNGHSYLPGGPVILDGAGTDLEDGPLTDDSRFAWRSSLQGLLGVGRRFQFHDLRRGQHTITLEVADSDGFVARSSVSIFIGQRWYLPVIAKAR